jgi:hypothetical protein
VEAEGSSGKAVIVRGPEAASHARPTVTSWTWRWRGWTRWPFSGAAVVVAAIAVVVDVATAWNGTSLGALGRVPISPALPLGLLLAGMIGFRRLGFDRANGRAWREFLVVTGFLVVYAVCMYGSVTGRWQEGVGLVVAAFGEELVYRLAVIVAVGALCARLLGRDWRNASEWGLAPGLAAVLMGGVVFSILPGHVAQMNDAFQALPFASLGLVLGWTVLRTGGIIPATFVHALMNLATIAAMDGNSPSGARNAFVAIALVTLVIATVVAGLRLGILRREPAVIDLLPADRERAHAVSRG